MPAKRRNLSTEERASIVAHIKDGLLIKDVAAMYKIHRDTVADIIKKHQELNTVVDRRRSGRPKKTTVREDRLLLRSSLKNRRLTSTALCKELQESTGIQLSTSCVRRRLLSGGLRGCIAVKKPLLSNVNRLKRLKWAVEHSDWTQNDWDSILWSDESSFEVFQGGSRTYVRRRVGESIQPSCVVPTVKFGGGHLMVWGCFSAAGVGELYRCEGTVNAAKYKDILQTCMLTSSQKLFGGSLFQFQQDLAPCHTAATVKQWFVDKDIRVLNWVPQSPDMNPIENIWNILKRKIAGQTPKNKDELWEIIRRAWYTDITPADCRQLVQSMPRRVAALRKAKGYCTKY